ncbi:MAG: TIGR03089 family protein [Kocuria sp.]|nr:TIGR03089 family protein [Kocuria sp.]
MSPAPETIHHLFTRLAHQPTPAMVFYGDAGERVELSGRVLENWVAKTANLFTDDCGLTPGDRVLVDPTAHWRNAVIISATWWVGATAVLPTTADQTPVEVAVTMTPEKSRYPHIAHTSADELIVVAYPALPMNLDPTQLPAGAIDFCAQVRAHGDHFSPLAATPPDQQTALESTYQLSYGEMLHRITECANQVRRMQPQIKAVHLDVTTFDPNTLPQVLGAWSAGVTVVLTDQPIDQVAPLLSTEKVGLTWG